MMNNGHAHAAMRMWVARRGHPSPPVHELHQIRGALISRGRRGLFLVPHAGFVRFLRCEVEISMAPLATAQTKKVNGAIRVDHGMLSIPTQSVHRAAIIIAYINGEAPRKSNV